LPSQQPEDPARQPRSQGLLQALRQAVPRPSGPRSGRDRLIQSRDPGGITRVGSGPGGPTSRGDGEG
jgi:hypothetical protein